MTVVGNTTMHHLALGVSPVGLGGAPFAPALAAPVTLRAAELGYAMNPEGGVHFPPPIAGFVGSDCLAVITATRLARATAPSLAIDIGTNTEIALAHSGRVVVTSCASGPAFEGYQITCGMKAVEGAIERIAIAANGEPPDVRTIGGREPLGICGSGVVDLLAGLVAAGIVDAGGRLQPHRRVRKAARVPASSTSSPRAAGRHRLHPARRALAAARQGGHRERLQAAAGRGRARTGAGRAGLVAGAFGNELDVGNSLAIGLLPAVPHERVAFVGNAAGVGAQMALIDIDERRAMAELASGLKFLDLATDRGFHEVFTGELGFA